MSLSESIKDKLICPITGSKLVEEENFFYSENNPSIRYPIIDGIPVIIKEENSLFSINDFLLKKSTTFDLGKNRIRKTIRKLVPSIGLNLKARKNYAELATILPSNATIFVIGGSVIGSGMEPLYSNTNFDIIGSDVSFGPHTKVINDAHDLPFKSETFDCVIIQAVLEHVLDPARCVSEIHRVLKPNGIVYAETPFMQQVHLKAYDFTRFSHLGHRRLFRNFEEVKSGPTGGPGMALAWSFTYFLKSFATSKLTGHILMVFAHFTSFFLKYFDYLLIDKPGAFDAASGFYFMGRKSVTCLSDRELIQQFKGLPH